jgi:hypothetical protein
MKKGRTTLRAIGVAVVQLPQAVSRRTRHERGQQGRATQTPRTLNASFWIESEWPDQRLNIDEGG